MAARRLVGKTPDPARHKSPNPQRLKEAEKEMKKRTKKPAGSDVESSSSKGSSSGLLRGERPGRDNTKKRLTFAEDVTVTPIKAEHEVKQVSKKKDAKAEKPMSEKEADSILSNFKDPPSVVNKDSQW